MGALEARLVLQELSRNSEATIWKPLPVGAILVCFPILLVLTVFGVSEYLPFILYFGLSAIPVSRDPSVQELREEWSLEFER